MQSLHLTDAQLFQLASSLNLTREQQRALQAQFAANAAPVAGSQSPLAAMASLQSHAAPTAVLGHSFSGSAQSHSPRTSTHTLPSQSPVIGHAHSTGLPPSNPRPLISRMNDGHSISNPNINAVTTTSTTTLAASNNSTNSSANIPPPGSESAHNQAKALLKETRDLERQLRQLQKSSTNTNTTNGSEKQIFALRKTIRHHYRQVIYLDLNYAAENEVEQCLWKYVFYKQIEELRKLLKQYQPKAATQSSLAAALAQSQTQLKDSGGGDRYQRLSTFFRQFLRDSKKFYRSLLNYHLKVAKIHRSGATFRDLLDPKSAFKRRVAGAARDEDEGELFDDEGEDEEENDTDATISASILNNIEDRFSVRGVGLSESTLSDDGANNSGGSDNGPDTFSHSGLINSSSTGTSAAPSLIKSSSYSASDLHLMHLALLTCHRSLIFLGDLERYSQLILGTNDSSTSTSTPIGNDSKDWSKAERYYRWALTLIPINGNPHNQLAVVATYRHNNLLAVHRYLRSIAVSQPFSTAMANLKLLFDKHSNTTMHAQHHAHHQNFLLHHSKSAASVTACCDYFEHQMPALRSIDMCLVYLLDVLYTGRHVDSGLCLTRSIVARLEHFLFNNLCRSPMSVSLAVGARGNDSSLSLVQSNSYCLQLLLNAIFCVHQHVPDKRIIATSSDTQSNTNTDTGSGDALTVVNIATGHELSASFFPSSFFAEPSAGSLAFIFVFDLMRGLLSSMKSQLLSKLGVVGIFCDWLRLYPAFIEPFSPASNNSNSLRQAQSNLSPNSQPSSPVERTDGHSSEANTPGAPARRSTHSLLPTSSYVDYLRYVRARCWKSLAELCDTLRPMIAATPVDVSEAANIDNCPLKEELEVYGFSYLTRAYPSLAHDFYWRRTDNDAIDELTTQHPNNAIKDSYSPPSVLTTIPSNPNPNNNNNNLGSLSSLCGSTQSGSAFQTPRGDLPSSSLKAINKLPMGLERRQYRRAMKIIHFADYLVGQFPSALRRDPASGRYYNDSGIDESAFILSTVQQPTPAPIVRSPAQVHASIVPSSLAPVNVLAAQIAASSPQQRVIARGGANTTTVIMQPQPQQPMHSQSHGGYRNSPSTSPASAIIHQLPRASTPLTATSPPFEPGFSPAATVGHSVRMPHSTPAALMTVSSAPTSNRRVSEFQSQSHSHSHSLAQSHHSQRKANESINLNNIQLISHSQQHQQRSGRSSQSEPHASSLYRQPGAPILDDTDPLDMDSELERRILAEKRHEWNGTEPKAEQASLGHHFDLHSETDAYQQRRYKGLINPPHQAQPQAQHQRARTRQQAFNDGWESHGQPYSSSAGAVGLELDGHRAANVSPSPTADYRQFHAREIDNGRQRGTSRSAVGSVDGWNPLHSHQHQPSPPQSHTNISLHQRTATAPLIIDDEPERITAPAAGSRGWTPFDSQTSLTPSFLHSSLFHERGGDRQSSSAVDPFEAQMAAQQLRLQQHRRPEQLLYQSGEQLEPSANTFASVNDRVINAPKSSLSSTSIISHSKNQSSFFSSSLSSIPSSSPVGLLPRRVSSAEIGSHSHSHSHSNSNANANAGWPLSATSTSINNHSYNSNSPSARFREVYSRSITPPTSSALAMDDAEQVAVSRIDQLLDDDPTIDSAHHSTLDGRPNTAMSPPLPSAAARSQPYRTPHQRNADNLARSHSQRPQAASPPNHDSNTYYQTNQFYQQ